MSDREKYLARQRRYNQSEKGKARYKRSNDKRVFAGSFYGGRVNTAAEATAFSEYANSIRADFLARQRDAYCAFVALGVES